MLLPEHDFQKPSSLADALKLLNKSASNIKLLAGGTDVVFNMRGRLFEPDILLSIKDLPELQKVIEMPDGSLSIGAGCRLTDLERHSLVTRYPGLVAGLRAVASRHVRNMATLGGNLNLDTRCWYTNQTAEWRAAKGPCLKTHVSGCHAIKSSDICVALNASDTAPALIALDAAVELVSASASRMVRLDDFYTDDGVRHTVRHNNEIMTRVILPPPAGRMVYIKETARKGNDFAYATIAVWADGEREKCGKLRCVVGSLTTRPVVLRGVAEQLRTDGITELAIGRAVESVRAELGTLTNLYTPAAYKGRIAKTLVRKALGQLRLM